MLAGVSWDLWESYCRLVMNSYLGVIRIIVFAITIFTHSPGLWLFPNLFADVGFFDSFRPWYSWHVTNAERERRKEQRRIQKAEKLKKKAEKKRLRELRKSDMSNSDVSDSENKKKQ
eukprot:NODE_130_length_16779_cov_1.687410.p17 type:complete len:117 gc:universal NODE_130_length_16779_cov_1.687410:819-1169(+)